MPKNSKAGKRAHKKIVKAVTEAESKGRVQWRNKEVGNTTFKGLNELLKRNGIRPLSWRWLYQEYCYPAVNDAFRGARIRRPVKVMTRQSLSRRPRRPVPPLRPLL